MTLTLRATPRSTATRGNLNALRKARKIPAVVYGHGLKNQLLVLGYQEFSNLYRTAGTSNLINLTIDGAAGMIPVLISEVQHDPLSDLITHVDLHQVRMDEKIKTVVHLEFSGESPAVKSLGGNLVISKDKLTIECLPKDLVSSIPVDLSVLENLGDSIHLRDLSIPKSLTVLDVAEESIVSVLAPRVEVPEEPPTPETQVIGEEPVAEPAAGSEAVPAGQTPTRPAGPTATREEKKP